MRTFSNHKERAEIKNTPYTTSPTWLIESSFIEIYSLLAHRIKGLGWSLSDFWETDTWTTSKLYCMELNLIDEENREFNKDKPESQNDPEVEELAGELFGEN